MKKKVNSIVIKETTIFKKSSSKATVEFEKCSSHIYRQVRAIGSATPRFPQSPQRNMQNNACTEQGREGAQDRGGGERKQPRKKLMHKVEGELFFLFLKYRT